MLLTTNLEHAVLADVVVIAVPTPLRDGAPDLSIVTDAVTRIAAVLRHGQLVVLESTTWPGTTEEVVVPLLEANGLTSGEDFLVAYSPERVNPGGNDAFSAVPKVVGGCGAVATELAGLFYGRMVDQVHPVSSPRSAEMAKLIENTFRQVNIALVNELVTVAPALGVDLWEALEAAATKSFGYLPFWPGPGVGGHCIAIDPSYLSWRVEQQLGFGIGFINHARSVNNRMPSFVCSRIADALSSRSGLALRGTRILLVGVAYKAGVNDVRESPGIAVAQLLQVIVVNDGSTDGTWARMLEAKRRWPQICAIDLGRNHGKRGAMAEGIRRAEGRSSCSSTRTRTSTPTPWCTSSSPSPIVTWEAPWGTPTCATRRGAG